MQFSRQQVSHPKTRPSSTSRALVTVGLHAARRLVMHAFLALLRRNVCAGKQTDVTRLEKRPIMYGTHIFRRSSEEEDDDDDDDDNEEELNHHHGRNYFPGKTVLEIGDPSRNVIEMIFRETIDAKRCSIKIKQVLKLNNSTETLERFENFREDVKNRACEHHNKNPRNIVDGNEQLLFYGTKLTCCKQVGTSKLYKDSNCIICSITKAGFYTAKKKTGIWLTTNCQAIINANANADMMNEKMAIVVCRVISGRVIDMNDSYDGGDYDSLEGVKPNYLFVKNPSAVLPCFVIILNCMYFC